MAAVASSPKVVAVGVNCTAPEFVDELLSRARTVTDKPLIAYPNAGRVYDAASKTWSGGEQTWDSPGAQRRRRLLRESARPRIRALGQA